MQTCNRCVMDSSDPDITFDLEGICNYCGEWEYNAKNYGKIENGLEVWEKQVLPEIRLSGQGKKFDCVIGVSGGIDSSYVVYIAKKYGLRAVLVHVANGFDTPEATHNLDCLVQNTGYMYIYQGNEGFREAQVAYLKASVLDADVPSDYLLEAINREVAMKFKIKYLLSGGNFYADAFMPKAWTYSNKLDYTNLKHITGGAKGFPKFGAWQVIKSRRLHGLIYLTPLNFFGYTREKALATLQQEWGYKSYGDKHDENIFTRFYQRFILPNKFGIDKRKANYSNFIRAGGWTRTQALLKLQEPTYPPEMFHKDKALVLEKLGLSEEEFDQIMALPIVPHSKFGSDQWIYTLMEQPYAKTRHAVGVVLRRLGAI